MKENLRILTNHIRKIDIPTSSIRFLLDEELRGLFSCFCSDIGCICHKSNNDKEKSIIIAKNLSYSKEIYRS